MANCPANAPGSAASGFILNGETGTVNLERRRLLSTIGLVCGIFLVPSLAPPAAAQSSPKVSAVDPAMGKVNDNVTLTGENLGKDAVAGVFLSDDKDDYKAALVEQDSAKIVMKVPQVKSGAYNISIQQGDKILILPLHFTVQA